MTDSNHRPSPSEMPYAQAWEEYQNNGEDWQIEHDEALQQVRKKCQKPALANLWKRD